MHVTTRPATFNVRKCGAKSVSTTLTSDRYVPEASRPPNTIVSEKLGRELPTSPMEDARAAAPWRGLGKEDPFLVPGSPEGKTRLQEPVLISNTATSPWSRPPSSCQSEVLKVPRRRNTCETKAVEKSLKLGTRTAF